jgi:hypothetical protein
LLPILAAAWQPKLMQMSASIVRLPSVSSALVGERVSYSTPKCALTPKAHKAIGKSDDSTLLTKVLDALRGVSWPREYSYRVLKNKLTDEWADR